MRTNSPQHRKSLGQIFLSAIVCVALFFTASMSLAGLRSGARDIFYPIFRIADKINPKISDLEEKNKHLEVELLLLKSQINNSSYEIAPADILVISQAPSIPFDTLIIKKESDNINIGSKIIALGGVYIGDIVETGDSTAVVKLLSYPALETEAWLDSAKLNITLIGQGGYNFKFQIPKAVPVSVGDRVMSNTSPQFIIAEVESVSEKPTEPLKEVLLRFPFNFRNLRHVSRVE